MAFLSTWAGTSSIATSTSGFLVSYDSNPMGPQLGAPEVMMIEAKDEMSHQRVLPQTESAKITSASRDAMCKQMTPLSP